MLKITRIPVIALVASAFLLSTAPSSHAAFSQSLYKSLLKKIYADSEDGDAGDIFEIIKRSLEKNPQDSDDLIKKLINALKKNRDQLAFDVSEEDLDLVFKKLRKFVKDKHNSGNINGSESGTRSR